MSQATYAIVLRFSATDIPEYSDLMLQLLGPSEELKLNLKTEDEVFITEKLEIDELRHPASVLWVFAKKVHRSCQDIEKQTGTFQSNSLASNAQTVVYTRTADVLLEFQEEHLYTLLREALLPLQTLQHDKLLDVENLGAHIRRVLDDAVSALQQIPAQLTRAPEKDINNFAEAVAEAVRNSATIKAMVLLGQKPTLQDVSMYFQQDDQVRLSTVNGWIFQRRFKARSFSESCFEASRDAAGSRTSTATDTGQPCRNCVVVSAVADSASGQ